MKIRAILMICLGVFAIILQPFSGSTGFGIVTFLIGVVWFWLLSKSSSEKPKFTDKELNKLAHKVVLCRGLLESAEKALREGNLKIAAENSQTILDFLHDIDFTEAQELRSKAKYILSVLSIKDEEYIPPQRLRPSEVFYEAKAIINLIDSGNLTKAEEDLKTLMRCEIVADGDSEGKFAATMSIMACTSALNKAKNINSLES